MASEMIERVARALARDEPDFWPEWVDDARAVIEAMREPNEAMIEASFSQIEQDGSLKERSLSLEQMYAGVKLEYSPGESSRDFYVSMIEAALK